VQSPPAAKNTGNPLVGSWEGRDRDSDGMGTTFVFGPRGTLEASRGLINNFQGQSQGAELIAQVRSAEGNMQQVHIHASAGNLTYATEGGGAVQEWIRVGSAVAGQPAWAGAWAFDHLGPSPGKKKKMKIRGSGAAQELMREGMRMIITPEGKGRLRFPVDSKIGAYVLQGDNRLVLQYEGRSLFMSWRLEGNTLYLLGEDAKRESAYDRVQ
jgi:hypothetical protein